MTSSCNPQTEELPLATSTSLLFVGDLSQFCTEKDLFGAFAKYGPVISAQIRKGRSGDSLMHGFVELQDVAKAQKAIESLNDTKFMGRRMRVNWAYSTLPPREKESWVQLHVSFVTRELNYVVTEATLDSVFSPFGEIADISLKKHVRDHETLVQSGYGFVYFFQPEGAVAARETVRKRLINGVTYDCSLSYRSEQDLKGKSAVMKAESKGNSPSGSVSSSMSHDTKASVAMHPHHNNQQQNQQQPYLHQPQVMQQFVPQMPMQFVPMQPMYTAAYPLPYAGNNALPQHYQGNGISSQLSPMLVPNPIQTSHNASSPPMPYVIPPPMMPTPVFIPSPHAMFSPSSMTHSPSSPYSSSPPQQQFMQQYMQGSSSPNHQSPLSYHMQALPHPQSVPSSAHTPTEHGQQFLGVASLSSASSEASTQRMIQSQSNSLSRNPSGSPLHQNQFVPEYPPLGESMMPVTPTMFYTRPPLHHTPSGNNVQYIMAMPAPPLRTPSNHQ